MRIRYEGPGDFVNVEPYGRHSRNQEKDYPEEFALELVATSARQQFAVADGGEITRSGDPEKMTVGELQALLEKLGVEIPVGAKKADLVELVYANTAQPPAEER